MKKTAVCNSKVSHPEKMICYCKHITQKEIETAIKSGAKTLSEIQQMTGACTGNQCEALNPSGKCCSADINQLLKNFSIEIIK